MKRILKTTCTAIALLGFATGSAMAGDAMKKTDAADTTMEQRAEAPVLTPDEAGDAAKDEVIGLDQKKPVVEGTRTERVIGGGEPEVMDDEKGDYAPDSVATIDQTKPVVEGVETGDAVAPEELAEGSDMERGDAASEEQIGIDQTKPVVEGVETDADLPAND